MTSSLDVNKMSLHSTHLQELCHILISFFGVNTSANINYIIQQNLVHSSLSDLLYHICIHCTTVTETKFLSLFALYTGNIIPKSLINLSVRKDHMFITKSKTGHPWNLAIIKHFYLTVQVTYHSHTIIQQ